MERGSLFPRCITSEVLLALDESRAVCLVGPRQVGKTTLARDLLKQDFPAEYFTLDDLATREAARSDPTGFVARLDTPSIIDEAQRAPDLLLAIKERLDRDNRPGRFLLTGSANIATMPAIHDALPGRVDYIPVWPLAQVEIERRRSNVIDHFFLGSVPMVQSAEVGLAPHADRIASGGFPGVLSRSRPGRRRFFEGYVDSLMRRDVPEQARLREASSVVRLLRLIAARSSTLVNVQALARDLAVDAKTVEAHLHILEDLLMVRRHPAWLVGLARRAIKHPKIYMVDTGMLMALVGADQRRFGADRELAGRALETFVAMELVKLASWSETKPSVNHFRDRDGHEVDVILELPDGLTVGVEVKTSASVARGDFAALSMLRQRAGDRFRAGIVIYMGATTLPFGDRLFAVPMAGLWSEDRADR